MSFLSSNKHYVTLLLYHRTRLRTLKSLSYNTTKWNLHMYVQIYNFSSHDNLQTHIPSIWCGISEKPKKKYKEKVLIWKVVVRGSAFIGGGRMAEHTRIACLWYTRQTFGVYAFFQMCVSLWYANHKKKKNFVIAFNNFHFWAFVVDQKINANVSGMGPSIMCQLYCTSLSYITDAGRFE